MKKTLIALAVVAASGASFAQVSVTGKLGYSFQKNAAAVGGAANQGMQMADGDINFTAKEDLGGGMSITAKQAFQLRGRDTGVTARDASLTLGTGYGSLMMGAVENCSRIDNVAGAPVSLATYHDGGLAPLGNSAAGFALDGSCNNYDTAAVMVPFGPVSLGLAYSEVGAGGGNASGANLITVSADYAAGPLALGIEFSSVKQSGIAAAGSAVAYHDGLARTRLTASYDMGVAKIGAGFQNANHNSANQYTLSAAVPLGAATVGLIYSNRAEQTVDATYYTAATGAKSDSTSAVAIGVDYSLSKLTTVNVSYGTYTNIPAYNNEYRIRLMKAF